MDSKNDLIILYSSQTNAVADLIINENEYFVKLKYIRDKYAEVADVFINAYEWYSREAAKIVQKPREAESAIWAFKDLIYIEKHKGSKILRMEVPIQEAVFFDMADWNKILNMSFVGLVKADEDNYKKQLSDHGIRFESDVVTTPFYPLFKRKLYKSWDNLFRYDKNIKSGDYTNALVVQAGLWRIKKEWVKEIME